MEVHLKLFYEFDIMSTLNTIKFTIFIKMEVHLKLFYENQYYEQVNINLLQNKITLTAILWKIQYHRNGNNNQIIKQHKRKEFFLFFIFSFPSFFIVK